MTHDLIKNSDGRFECRVCGQTWTRRPHARCPGPTHDLIQHALDHFECRVCAQVWSSPPQNISDNRCPQLRVYPTYAWEPLMSAVQLDYANYRATKNALPRPVGCYRSGNGSFVMLYDPAQAQQKSNPSQRRETLCISEICWPQTWCLWLDGVANSREDGSPRFSQREVLALVYHLFLFTPAEIEHFAGPCIRFKIRPMVIHRLHRTFVDSRKERETLYVNIILSYRDFKVAQ